MRQLDDLADSIDRIAVETRFSGVVRVDDGERAAFARAYGLAHRGHGIANTLDTQFAIASGVKGLTALSIVSLIEEARLELATTARSVLGADLPLIGDDVTVEQLLAHRSGIGDYLEEGNFEITDYVLPVLFSGGLAPAATGGSSTLATLGVGCSEAAASWS